MCSSSIATSAPTASARICTRGSGKGRASSSGSTWKIRRRSAQDGERLCALRPRITSCGRPIEIKPDLLVLASAITAQRKQGLVRTVQGAGQRRRIPGRSPRQTAAGGFRLRGHLHGRTGPLSQIHRRNHRPGQGRGLPGHDHPVQERDHGGRRGGRGRCQPVRGLSDLRANLSLPRALYQGAKAMP